VDRLARKFEALTFRSSRGDSLLYRLLIPRDYDPERSYPLLVALSGSRGRGTDNLRQMRTTWAAQILADSIRAQRHPCFVLVPQCPPRMTWRVSGGAGRRVLELVDALKTDYNIDPDRVYVTGQSMGGFGSWDFIAARPGLFAAAVPVCGGGKPTQAGAFAHVPVWAFHGAKDRTVSVERTRQMIRAIERAGGEPRYTEYPEGDHSVWAQVWDTPELLDWLFSQKRAQ
jgi:predicted peptidase